MAEYTGKRKTAALSIENAYTGIDELPLYNFDMYRKTADLNWFIQGYTGKESKLELHLLKPIETAINEAYYQTTEDRSFELMMKRLGKINELIAKHYRVQIILFRMHKGFGNSVEQQTIRIQFIKELHIEGFKMDLVASPSDDFNALEIIADQLAAINTKISTLKEENKKAESGVSMTLQRQLLILSSALNLGYKINPKDTSVLDFIEMNKLLEEKSKLN